MPDFNRHEQHRTCSVQLLINGKSFDNRFSGGQPVQSATAVKPCTMHARIYRLYYIHCVNLDFGVVV